jgi:hypothetical protein
MAGAGAFRALFPYVLGRIRMRAKTGRWIAPCFRCVVIYSPNMVKALKDDEAGISIGADFPVRAYEQSGDLKITGALNLRIWRRIFESLSVWPL